MGGTGTCLKPTYTNYAIYGLPRRLHRIRDNAVLAEGLRLQI